jgi:hypothetical protein
MNNELVKVFNEPKPTPRHAWNGTLYAAWLQIWKLFPPKENSPNIRRILRALGYLRTYALEWAYIDPHRLGETRRALIRRVYGTLRTMSKADAKPREVRIKQLHPEIEWARVWHNLRSIRLTERAQSAWYSYT